MISQQPEQKETAGYDTTVIRPIMLASQIQRRGAGFSEEKLNKTKKTLRKLHTLELMAQTIYRFQITNEKTELNRQLIAAMCNEITHYQDFTVLLYEFGLTPSPFRWAFWLAGLAMGLYSRLKGPQAILKLDKWVEQLAADDYERILDRSEIDEYFKGILEKNQTDEFGHIDRWTAMLAELTD
jgi:demethoxyubiquinone hydroxylase (CLK1/Coq7/Cat5 family)